MGMRQKPHSELVVTLVQQHRLQMIGRMFVLANSSIVCAAIRAGWRSTLGRSLEKGQMHSKTAIRADVIIWQSLLAEVAGQHEEASKSN